ncbi:hypothetical protein [Sandaracinus amylolyticus]|uniref:hypothetical protein n=1 Tax=Sandaracinus amylolyticus TaxID=927083 RepID=UPI001F27785A|nr:hypothetical protein [Sandaracinus amylolyticus]UJR78293.1 Hypothetical protein I5071_3200 [Sandaracinus amylolyticus]
MRARFVSSFAVVCLLLAPSLARAQRNLDVERFAPAPDGDGFLTIPGTRTPGPWRWNVALWLGYAHEPLTVRLADGSSVPAVENRFGGDLLFQLGILGRFAVVIDAPIVLYQDGEPQVIDMRGPLQTVALRDPRIAVRARLLGEDATEERERHEGEGLAIQIATTVPIGHEDTYAGEGNPQLDGALLADFHLLDLGVGGIVGVRHRFAEPTILGVPFRNELYFGLGLQVPAFFVEDLFALAEVNVATDLENPFGDEASTYVEWLLGVRGRPVRDLELSLAGGTGLTGGVGTTAFRVVAGVSWAPRFHDRDHDQIGDDDDECPTLPEDLDEHLDEDGCPEPDNDGDLVPDLDDRCPNEAADFGSDNDDDGCNDPQLDQDGDGVLDASDTCPAMAEDADGHDDGDGCPDLDDDGDEVPDDRDACRAEPEDRDGASDDDGCPDLDDDGDGIPQGEDRCEGAAEDRDGVDDADGCPDVDDDRDGVLDASDTCRDRAEDVDGRADDDGCPEPGGRAAWRVEGTAGTADRVITGSAPRFAADGTIAPGSSAAIDQLARLVIASWGTRARVAIGGAADEARVAGLRAALIARGVSEGAIDVVADPSVRGLRVTFTP